MSLTCLNPSMMARPLLSQDMGVSNDIIKKMIESSAPVTLALHFVDVRDVAEAHIQAMKNQISDGKRLIVSEREIWLKDIADLLGNNGYKKAPRVELPNFCIRIFPLLSEELRSVSKKLSQKRTTPASRAKRILAWLPRDARNSILESAQQICELR